MTEDRKQNQILSTTGDPKIDLILTSLQDIKSQQKVTLSSVKDKSIEDLMQEKLAGILRHKKEEVQKKKPIKFKGRMLPLSENSYAKLVEKIGQYKIISYLMGSDFSHILEIEDKSQKKQNETFQIELFHPHLSRNQQFAEFFQKYVKDAKKIHHKNILETLSFGFVDEVLYAIEEFFPCKDLKSLLLISRARSKPVSLESCIAILLKIISALCVIHERINQEDGEKDYHGGISPDCVLISYDGEVKIKDYGVSRAINKVFTNNPQNLGYRIAYLAPEQAWQHKVDYRCDIFSCGILMYEMFTGRKLFTGRDEIKVLEEIRLCKIPTLRRSSRLVPEELNEIIYKALSKTPKDRYKNIKDMKKDLISYFDKLGVSLNEIKIQNVVKNLLQEVPLD